ncbi:hypothetical protein CFC21_042524 [Triticum aestivum]|uniref:Uncharacterized protein n=2 Tax=Triticum aestivum TaxID=4565 RepID=A0A3B6FRF2_WHEAT|nr:hypothetical protein CFC21_042524 [Triticum aestivum]
MGLGILGVFLVFINQVIVAAYASGWCLCLCCCCPCWTKRRRMAPTPSKWNPDCIRVTGFVGTAIALGCFSSAAIITKRREYLYLGGLTSSGMSILRHETVCSVSSLPFGAHAITACIEMQLYIGMRTYACSMLSQERRRQEEVEEVLNVSPTHRRYHHRGLLGIKLALCHPCVSIFDFN